MSSSQQEGRKRNTCYGENERGGKTAALREEGRVGTHARKLFLQPRGISTCENSAGVQKTEEGFCIPRGRMVLGIGWKLAQRESPPQKTDP